MNASRFLPMLTVGLCLAMASTALSAGEAANAVPEEEFDIILRNDGKTSPPTRIVQDNYLMVIGKRGGEVKVPSCLVKEVIYSDKDANYAAAIEKRDEGRYTLAAMYYLKGMESMSKQKWAVEYCNYGIGNALFEAGQFGGYTGRSGTKYDSPVVYFKRALEANPKSRFTLDIMSKIPRCLAEQGKLDEAEAALKEAEARIKSYRDETIKVAQEFGEQCDRATAAVAIASARVAEQKAVKDGKWNDVKEKWLAARFKCTKYPELLADAVDGVLKALVMMKDYNGAKAEADAIVEKYKKEGEKHLPLLPSAYTVLGKANLAQAVEFEGKGAKIQALNAYADARWAFLHIIAQFFDNDDYVASAHYFAGLCYDKLKDVESDASEKAVREWKLVTTDFKKSDFNEPAIKELERVGVKTVKDAPPAAPKAAAPDKPAADKPAEGEKPPAKAPAKAPAKK
jgi:tetratricopeptide (TPR) repeat protein